MNLPAFALALFLAATAITAQARDAFDIGGWSEIVLSVSDLDTHRAFYEDIAGWAVRAEGPLDADTLAAWGLGPEVTARQVLLGNPGTPRGFVRLVRFEGAAQVQIRPHAQTWESGGILDFNVRVADMARKAAEVQAAGWIAHSDPVRFSFGPFTVVEWIPVGPDGVSLAMIERVAPPLEGWPELREFSRTFNSTQVVRDLDAALAFYEGLLGFRPYLESASTTPPPGENVLGLPWETAQRVQRRVWIGSFAGDNEGSVELIEFDGASGRDLAERAVPPNLGMLMLRFPVRGLDALARHLDARGAEPLHGIREVRLAPGGAARQLSLRAPDGAWLDFYEPTGD